MRRSLAVLVAAALVQAPAAAGWSWPVDGPVLRPFVLGDDPYAAGQHRGIDIGATPGTTVRAATAGSVSFVGAIPAGGRAVTVRTAGGLSVTYVELGTTRVERGAEVAEGDAVGTIGPASHVHLGVRVTEDPQGYLDPLQFLPPRASGPARADPVPDPVAGDLEPKPVAQAASRVEPPAPRTTVTPQTAVTPKSEPEPVVAAPSAPGAAPSSAPVAAASAPASPTAASAPAPATRGEPVPEAKVVESSAPKPERAPVVRDRPKPSLTRGRTAPEVGGAGDGPATDQLPRQSNVAAPTRRTPRSRPTPRRIVTARVRITRDEPKAVVTVAAPKGSAVESPRTPRPSARRSDSEPSIARVLLLACCLLGVVAAVAAALRRRHRRTSVLPQSVGACSRPRLRPPRLLHGCARAGESGWLAAATRSRSVVALHRPLPRPRRRVPVETRR
jgi:hypothetical protein